MSMLKTADDLFSPWRKELAANGVLKLKLKVRPGAVKTAIIGQLADDTIKVDVAAAPEKNRANEELTVFFARQLGCDRSGIKLTGQNSRRKSLLIRITD